MAGLVKVFELLLLLCCYFLGENENQPAPKVIVADGDARQMFTPNSYPT